MEVLDAFLVRRLMATVCVQVKYPTEDSHGFVAEPGEYIITDLQGYRHAYTAKQFQAAFERVGKFSDDPYTAGVICPN